MRRHRLPLNRNAPDSGTRDGFHESSHRVPRRRWVCEVLTSPFSLSRIQQFSQFGDDKLTKPTPSLSIL